MFICFTASTKVITDAMMALFDRITDPNLLVRRINIVACRVKWGSENVPMQLDLFTDPRETEFLEKEKRRQQAVLKIRKKYGKNAILKGMNFQEGATTRDRNAQIGGHKA